LLMIISQIGWYMRRYALRDDQWERIRDFLPGRGSYLFSRSSHMVKLTTRPSEM